MGDALGMATIVLSRGVVRGKAADATSRTVIGPVATKLASQPHDGVVRTITDTGFIRLIRCGIARTLPPRRAKQRLTMSRPQRLKMLRPMRHHRFTRRRPSFGRPMSTTQPQLMAVARRMALIAVTFDVVPGKAADAMSRTTVGLVAMSRASLLHSGRELIIMDIGREPISLCGIVQISPRRPEDSSFR